MCNGFELVEMKLFQVAESKYNDSLKLNNTDVHILCWYLKDLRSRIAALEKENESLKHELESLRSLDGAKKEQELEKNGAKKNHGLGLSAKQNRLIAYLREAEKGKFGYRVRDIPEELKTPYSMVDRLVKRGVLVRTKHGWLDFPKKEVRDDSVDVESVERGPGNSKPSDDEFSGELSFDARRLLKAIRKGRVKLATVNFITGFPDL
jgi:regulator of replication initiation timing